jgi:MFS family permease
VAATAPHTAPTLASLGLAVLCVSQFVDVLSVNTAIIALPDIRADLGMGAAGAQWVISVYALLFGSLLLFAGRLADRVGRRGRRGRAGARRRSHRPRRLAGGLRGPGRARRSLPAVRAVAGTGLNASRGRSTVSGSAPQR